MPRTLSDDDIEAIALRLFKLVITKLVIEEKPKEPPPLPPPPPAPPPEPKVEVKTKTVYSVKELAAELGISQPTVYRLMQRRLLKPLPYLRHKRFTRAEVERFLASGEEWNATWR